MFKLIPKLLFLHECIANIKIYWHMFYFFSVKLLFTNKAYLGLLVGFGSLVGFFNCFATQMEQFMCSRGYQNTFSGLCVALLIIVGMVGSIIAGVITDKTGKMEEVAKISNMISVFVLVTGFVQIIRKPDLEVAVALISALYVFQIIVYISCTIYIICLKTKHYLYLQHIYLSI